MSRGERQDAASGGVGEKFQRAWSGRGPGSFLACIAAGMSRRWRFKRRRAAEESRGSRTPLSRRLRDVPFPQTTPAAKPTAEHHQLPSLTPEPCTRSRQTDPTPEARASPPSHRASPFSTTQPHHLDSPTKEHADYAWIGIWKSDGGTSGERAYERELDRRQHEWTESGGELAFFDEWWGV